MSETIQKISDNVNIVSKRNLWVVQRVTTRQGIAQGAARLFAEGREAVLRDGAVLPRTSCARACVVDLKAVERTTFFSSMAEKCYFPGGAAYVDYRTSSEVVSLHGGNGAGIIAAV